MIILVFEEKVDKSKSLFFSPHFVQSHDYSLLLLNDQVLFCGISLDSTITEREQTSALKWYEEATRERH